MGSIQFPIVVVLSVCVIFGSRRVAIVAIAAGVLFTTQYQSWDIAGLNIFPVRVIEIVAAVRVLLRNDFSCQINQIDFLFLVCYGYTTAVFLLRSPEGQWYELGMLIDAMLCYFVFRALIKSPAEWTWFLRAFSIILCPFVVALLIERLTGHGPFSRDDSVSWIRDNKVRCFGSFRHPSLLGTIGATFLPFFLMLLCSKENRGRAVLGAALCLVIVVLANSGGPVTATAVAIGACCLWRIRYRMRLVRWGLACAIGFAALIMKAPIWYLIERVSLLTNGDGWHRARLLDMATQHLNEWWLAGMRLEDTIGWLPYNLRANGGADVTNQFISLGLQAGIGAIILFIILLARCFYQIGGSLQILYTSEVPNTERQMLLWSLGAALVTHAVNWLGITYFDQSYVFWFLQLAAISTIVQFQLNDFSCGDCPEDTWQSMPNLVAADLH